MNSLGREKGDTKEFRRLVLLFFCQREKRRKDSTLLFSAEFSVAEKQSLKPRFRKIFGKSFCTEKTMGNGQKGFERDVFFWMLLLVKKHVKVLLL